MGTRLRLTLWVALAAGTCAAAAAPPLRGFGQSALDIQTRAGVRHYAVYLAITAAQQERGLMFVRQLPARTGMLFPLRAPSVMTMWMKNTLIPLDLLFIGTDGRIACLRRRAVPQSLDLISCDTPVREVLEIGGGEAEMLGIEVGDRVIHPDYTR